MRHQPVHRKSQANSRRDHAGSCGIGLRPGSRRYSGAAVPGVLHGQLSVSEIHAAAGCEHHDPVKGVQDIRFL